MKYSHDQAFLSALNNAVIQNGALDSLKENLIQSKGCADGYQRPSFWQKILYTYAQVDMGFFLDHHFFFNIWYPFRI